MMKSRIWGALALVSAFACVAHAQETTSGSIGGVVRDAQGATVPGASVTLATTRGVRTLVTDARGGYFAPFLEPGVYSVKAELAGFSPTERKGVAVRLGQRVELDFTLKVGDLQEVVEVVGAAPVVDTSSTTAGGVLDNETIKRLPVGRRFTDALYLVPGVSDSSGVGKANPSIAGGSGLENNYVVDGVNITDVGFGGVGTYNPIFGSLGTGVTTDFVKETQVKTGGFEAEYGESTGGVVNVITQSGGNKFSGSLFGYFRPSALESSYRQLSTPNGSVNTTGQDQYDFGASLGGPLVQNKLFFFGTFNPQFESRTFTAPPGFPLASLGGVDRKRHTYSYAGKLTWQVTSNHKVDIAAFGDPSRGDAGPQRFNSLRRFTTQADSGFSEIKFGGHQQSLRYDGILTPNWLIEASVSHSSNKFDEIPAVNNYGYTDRTTVPNQVFGGLGGYQITDGKNTQFTAKSTNIFNLGGKHQVRYGAEFQDIEFSRVFLYTGPTFTLSNGIVTTTGANVSIQADDQFGKIYRVTRANFSPKGITTQKYLSLFLQDTWEIGSRLTIRPGVRWDRQRLIGQEPGNGSPAVCSVGESRPGANDGTGGPKACEFTWDDNIAPRIGVIYDVLGNGRSKIYASWGRFYAKIPNDLAARALSSDAGVTRADYFDAALTRPVANGVSALGTTSHLRLAGVGAAIIDPNAKATYKSEIVTGVEFEVASSLNFGLRYVRRTIPRILEDIGQAPVTAYEFPAFADLAVDYFITNVNASTKTVNCCGLPAASFEDPTHKYEAFELTATKSFSNNWGLVGSYRYSRLKGNFEGFYRSDNGQSDPAITSLFDFPTNEPGYTQVGRPLFGFRGDIRFQGTTLGEGRLPNDRPHQLKIYGNYTWNALNLGLGFNAGSGRVLTGLNSNPVYNNSGEIPETLRGGGIQTNADGLRTRAPIDLQFDLHADYTVKLNGSQRVLLIVDVFNLFNRQEPDDYDNFIETAFLAANPNFGYATNGGGGSTSSFQTPRQVRLGARFEW